MNVLNELEKLKQNSIQFGVSREFRIHKSATRCIDSDEELVMYYGCDPTVELACRSEYEFFKKVYAQGSDENNLLFSTTDKDKIIDILNIVDNKEKYEYPVKVEKIINAIMPKKELKRVPSIDNK